MRLVLKRNDFCPFAYDYGGDTPVPAWMVEAGFLPWGKYVEEKKRDARDE